MWEIALLGPLEVKRDGISLRVPNGKTSELLVRLALDAGVVVTADRLVDDLWTARAVTTDRNTLQAKVAKLRRALRDPQAVVTGDGGYTLAVEPSAVDATVALASVGTATRLLETGDSEEAADLCASTLALFGDIVLPAAGGGEWVDPHRARLEEARIALVELGLSARLQLHDGDVVGDLEAATSAFPFREGLWELLITALYRAGRQADALAAYQRVRADLADELGLDPGPRLKRLEQQILSQDPSLDNGDHSIADLISGNLPSMAPALVGRDAEVAAVCELLASERLVEIVGPGGIGKTALAIAVGRTLTTSSSGRTRAAWLARLETAVTPDDVVDTLIAALNVAGGEAALFERLKGGPALVILDNCEHVVDAARALAVRLLDAAPELQILCTTQTPLDIDAETVFDLVPLSLADAVELFTRRASPRRLRQGADATSDDAVVELCRSLDGLPLAIELAAARTKTLPVGEIGRRLEDRFSVLSDPTSRRPERRRSLRSTIGWSYDLLFPDDQRGLWALATFAGGAPLPAVERVLHALDVPAEAAIDVIGRLESRSLLIVDESPATRAAPLDSSRASPDSVRYRLLDSIRAFALETMAEAGLSDRALAAHAAWFAATAFSSTDGVRSSRQGDHLAVARAERANIDAALAWSAVHEPRLALEIVNGFGWAWVVLGDSRGAQRILTVLDAVGDAGKATDRANALLLAAWIEASTGHLEPARSHVAAAAGLADALDDAELHARCSYYLAYVVSHRGEFRRAMELTDRSRVVYDRLDRPWDRAASGLFAARAAISAGDEQRSVEAAEQVQAWLREVDDPWLHVRGDAMLGELARLQRRFEDAVVHIGRAAQTSQRLGFLQTEAYQLASLGRAQCQAGDYDAGQATLEIAIGKAQAVGDVRLVALTQVHLGRVLRAVEDLPRARAALEAASAWHRDAGGGEQAALGECLLAAMDAADGEPGAAERLAEILEGARRSDDAPVEVFALDALARVAVGAGDHATARHLCETADQRMEAASHFITDLDRVDARSASESA